MTTRMAWRRARAPEPGASRSMREDVLAGLRAAPKTLSPKYFYDATGAELFEAITRLPEYYPTRTELAILRTHARDIAERVGPNVALIEYGSGAAIKARLVLDALESPAAYVPVDISSEQLARVASERRREYPGLRVLPVCADYTTRLTLPDLPAGSRKVAFFPGSTIGNFHPAEATAFLKRVRTAIGPGGAMILGVDRRKDPQVLHDAYNDRAGVTAAFNRNALVHLNRELGATFDLTHFAHRAFFSDAESRIEMHLEALVTHTVTVGGTPVSFERGETIHTESSYKYDAARLEAVVGPAGFAVREWWTDERSWFWVVLLEGLAHA